MDAFVAAGGNFIDTADVYSAAGSPGNPGGVSEEIIGRWLKARGNRDQIVLATKVRGRMWEGPNGEGLSRVHIIKACEDSLRRLQTDYHRPLPDPLARRRDAHRGDHGCAGRRWCARARCATSAAPTIRPGA